MDEAGRGTLAGPVSVGCVSFSLSTLEKIKNGEILKGLRDSKKIPEPKRMELRTEILKYVSYFRVTFVSAKFIDQFNINQAIFYGMNRCLPTNPEPFEPNRKMNEKLNLSASTNEEKTNRNEDKLLISRPYLLADGNYKLKITKPIEGYFSLPKGDDLIPSISAASILAKTYRDEYMEKMDVKYPGYGFAKHKGYGTEEHREALMKLGISPIHRLSFCKFLRHDGSEPTLF
ncbi:ribonuclease HII [Leptospira congkakensis]|uniref:Ribonuclease n=1 Tax=Leptospira congkakensis TaxID=2484932 RepID=A0A4Z1AD66_9LEPT|nr:ribonuclease HII [Leptospira congkakensis]TGL91556.1 ribonuclease HII [Leptospira congkakensis]TGL98610.1 ribonuclease HII [Leptospira congkakensis]